MSNCNQFHGIKFISSNFFYVVNVIREALKQRLVVCSDDEAPFLSNGSVSRSPRLTQVAQLHAIADAKCQQFARLVVGIVRRHLGSSFFEFDASLVRDGCFYAGLLLAGESGTEEEVHTCLQALRDMRWAFSKSEEREHTLQMVWEQRLTAESQRGAGTNFRRMEKQDFSGSTPSFSSTSTENNRMRQPPPPLMIAQTTLHDSAPSTAVTSDDGGWTVISNAPHGIHSHRSSSGSPPFMGVSQSSQHLGPKVEALASTLMLGPVGEQAITEPMYYQHVHEMDSTFAYSIVPGTTASAPHSPHDFTPPRSSAGMSSSSVSYHEPYFGSAGTPLFTISPPGSARGTADSGSLASDKGASYHVNYTGSPFYVTP